MHRCTPAKIKTFTGRHAVRVFRARRQQVRPHPVRGRRPHDGRLHRLRTQDERPKVGLPGENGLPPRVWDKDPHRGFRELLSGRRPRFRAQPPKWTRCNFEGPRGRHHRRRRLAWAEPTPWNWPPGAAKIVVNDLGGARDGSGGRHPPAPADKVVEEITGIGQQTPYANYDNVATRRRRRSHYPEQPWTPSVRVDIVINNAGILRDKSFLQRWSPDNWNAVLAVHLNGAYNVTKPAFPIMKEQGFGRIIMTTSAAGLYGNFGQTNYSSCQDRPWSGFMNTLKLEGEKIQHQGATPWRLMAASRLTEDIHAARDLFAKMKPEFVSPMVHLSLLRSAARKPSGRDLQRGHGLFQPGRGHDRPRRATGRRGRICPTLEDDR